MPEHTRRGGYCRFLVRHPWLALLLAVGLGAPALFWARHVTLASKMTDYYPARHPHVRLYREFTEMLRLTNVVVVTVSVTNGTVYTADVLGKIHRLTVALLDTRGVNPFEVMSLTHPRLKDIRVRDGSINILPVVDRPGQPQSPEALAHIKNAVYTNLGIRGVYVSPDDKTALIRAGFWDGMAEPKAVLARLQAIADRERDGNTAIEFSGNLVLGAWLIELAPRVLGLLLLSGGVVLLLLWLTKGFWDGVVITALVSLPAALWAFGLLGALRLSLEPLALLALFPLFARSVTLAVGWQSRLAHEYHTAAAPFAGAEGRSQAVERTAAGLWRPVTAALALEAVAMALLRSSDVPLLRSLGALGLGWMAGLLLALWVLLPPWSSLVRPRSASQSVHSWGGRLAARVTRFLSPAAPSPFPWVGAGSALALGALAALSLEAGRELPGTTLLPAAHAFNRATAVMNAEFIGANQLIVIAQTRGEATFRNPHALAAVEAFQHHMGEDEACGGALAVTTLIKSVTRMFHEDIPKWEVIPDDLDAAGQVLLRVITSAATPSEVDRFLSSDLRTTAISLFYRDYAPAVVARALRRASEFNAGQDGRGVRFRLGGGLLGILAAVHDAAGGQYWRTLGVFALLTPVGAVLGLGPGRAVLGVTAVFLLTQAVMLCLLSFGGVDLNMYTLPVVLLGIGLPLLPAMLARTPAGGAAPAGALVITSLALAGGVGVWLFSALQLQVEVGAVLLTLVLLNGWLPLRLSHLMNFANQVR